MNIITNNEVTDIYESMPAMPGSFVGKWGYIHFAEAIEAKVVAKLAAKGGINDRTFHELAMDYRAAPPFQAHVAYTAMVNHIDSRLAATTAASAVPAEPVAYVNGDELDNMLDDRTATIQGQISGFRKTPLYRAAPSAALSEKAEPQWISVDDECKPNEQTPILVFVRTLTRGEDDDGRPYEVEGEQVEMGEYRHNNGLPYFQCFISPMSDIDWITHWMRLPAPPATTKDQADSKGGDDA